MNFALFMLLNGILLIRPEEIIPDLTGARLYLIVIGLCTLFTFPKILIQFFPSSLAERPITVCVFLLMLAMALSQLVRLQFKVMDEAIPEFAKVILYYLLFLAIIDSPKRIFDYMGWIIFFVIVLATLGLLQFHEYIDVEALKPIEQREYDPETNAMISYPRLCSTGIYNDPNDLCLILTTGTICCLCRSSFAPSALMRYAWLCPIGIFAYAMVLTKSRGGLLGLMAAIAGLLYARYGWKKSLPLALLILPAMVVAVGGRQANLNTSGNDTSGERLRLWSDGLSLMMMRNPLTGIGVGEYVEEFGLVAHNSFVHAFVEMGVFGGTLFLGAFYLAFWGLNRTKHDGYLDHDPVLFKLQPFIVALVVGYAGGCYSVSRNFVIPTYMILGFSAVFMAITYSQVPEWYRMDKKLAVRLVIVGAIGFVFLKVFTQVFVQYG